MWARSRGAHALCTADEDAIELGELSAIGRVAPARNEEEAVAHTQGNGDAETQAVPPPASLATEGMDDIDAALAELIPGGN